MHRETRFNGCSPISVDINASVTNRSNWSNHIKQRHRLSPAVVAVLTTFPVAVVWSCEVEIVLCGRFSGNEKRLRLGNYQTIDDAVLTWFKDARQHGLPLSGPIIQEKARQFAVALDTSGFDASAGWLYWFQQRNGIVWKVACGEEKAADAENCDDEAELDPELWNELTEKLPVDAAVTFEDYVDSDCAAATSAELTCEEIVSQVREQDCCNSDEHDAGDAESGTMEETISSSDVVVFLEKTRSYLGCCKDVPKDILRKFIQHHYH
ncbi:hypothetical protein HPB52_000712 [Rhipicephalus sanguineus]|uniref:HTH CENPB-type domain-containing protein n=1 Tax=Rhipicephalus sanguineus TaxID=34632 RepID=A0A9D4QF15_RHISA|nr:hypothetical protein HPB52_000712 [Rhipicephalus sanguineus]